jgi:hypothetical protein
MTLSDRILAAIETHLHLAHEHHLGQCTVWTEGWQLKPGPCNCYGPDEVRRHCEADKRTVERHRTSGVTVLVAGQERHFCARCHVLMPCPDLLDRADAWGVATEETT